MFGDQAADPRHDVPEIQLKPCPQQGLFGDGHLEDHESCSRLQHASSFSQAAVQIYQVANTPPYHRAIERSAGERQLERVSGYGVDPV
jgi:hypothetical protein